MMMAGGEQSASSRAGQSGLVAPNEYVPALDGWRALAISLVVVFHGLETTSDSRFPRLSSITAMSGRLAALGVLVFFIISGYLITSRLIAELGKNGDVSLKRFYIRRAFRILPPVAMYLAVILVLHVAGMITLLPGDWSAVFFFANYWPQRSWYTTHFWSLSVEEHFYLLWPAVLALRNLKFALLIGLGAITAVALWRPWNLHHSSIAAAAGLLQHTDMRLDYLMVGCVVALGAVLSPRVHHAIGSLSGFVPWSVLLLCLAGSSFQWMPFDSRSLQAAILALLVGSTAIKGDGLVGNLLRHPALLFVGKISYSVYIWQELALAPWKNPSLVSLPALPIKIAIIFLVATLSYYFLETPTIRIGRRLAARTQ